MLMSYMLFIFFCGIWMFCYNYRHLLITLLSLEFLVLVMFLNMCMFLIHFNYEFYFLMIFLIFSVCEGSLGLSLLVSVVRGYGSDYFQLFNLLEC